MAEEESGQEQESQPAGSGGGFVSLEQAWDIALGQARDNQGFYGGRWSKRPLTWLVLVSEEREDAYYIRLSYQPAQKFSGESGVEAFTISKTGEVQSRSNSVSAPNKAWHSWAQPGGRFWFVPGHGRSYGGFERGLVGNPVSGIGLLAQP